MLMWLRAPDEHPLGIEHGIVRAGEVTALQDIGQARADMLAAVHDRIREVEAQAEAFLEQAQAEARQLIAEAQAGIEAARRQGFEEGRREAALEWHERQAGQALGTAQSLQSLHHKMATIVTTAVERIVHTEDRDGLYQRALRSVHDLIRDATPLKLRVSPADEDAARSSLSGATGMNLNGLSVEVTVDNGLPPDSCIFESESGVFDASLQTQLTGLRLAMERAVRRAVAEEDARQTRDGGTA